ncbi:unnamed protein product [Pleuronectes platessa]|uniref:Uncharacterized protein n=1 Tax=Pleuronectes platessa TaxID=8262 RepID=A0A9N7Z981_PLEPL|nr:unnamed protein product [Pleuronectes platessa]
MERIAAHVAAGVRARRGGVSGAHDQGCPNFSSRGPHTERKCEGLGHSRRHAPLALERTVDSAPQSRRLGAWRRSEGTAGRSGVPVRLYSLLEGLVCIALGMLRKTASLFHSPKFKTNTTLSN